MQIRIYEHTFHTFLVINSHWLSKHAHMDMYNISSDMHMSQDYWLWVQCHNS